MATMYYLFLCLVLIAICDTVDAVHHPVGIRQKIIHIASGEIGVREATGRNDGKRVAEYLRYTGLGKGYAWCSAFVSWCYGQAGLDEPRNPWSPALFPNARTYCRSDACRRSPTLMRINPADIFGIYGQSVRRINHVGLVKEVQGKYLITIEGNSNNRVESKRRHLATIYALADWVGGGR
ncbi:CHAP domain-containing protein [Sphingobacterium arenae]|uniref:CHAP domain-containing protein n=1 Tax=Sphingobacterium arenae TaxID=1280598 RepID=A0ABR7Y1P1_9SPHI|nr:CHAP domain-containing protein [Sphingobacterium arenae]MBD1425214.1 CHAP domain-containing protein [Sphingobacterium arenae]